MNGILTEMGIQFEVLPDFIEGATEAVESAVFNMKNKKAPYALLVKRQTFVNYKLKNPVTHQLPLNREQALKCVLKHVGKHDAVVGKFSPSYGSHNRISLQGAL
jgi:phosphonopyruvate decarboxylase